MIDGYTRGSRRAIAFRDCLNDREKEEVCGLVRLCNLQDKTNYSAPLDGDMYFLCRNGDAEGELTGILSVWHLGSTSDGKELDEIAAFTRPDQRRKGVFTELYESAGHLLREALLFSVYKNEGAERTLEAIGGHFDHGDYLMELELRGFRPSGEDKGEWKASFRKQEDGGRVETDYGEANYRFNSDGSVYIYGVLVYDRFRGRGMGRRLLELLLSGLRAQGAERAVLEVFSENLPAVRLYESLGFSIKEKIDYAVL